MNKTNTLISADVLTNATVHINQTARPASIYTHPRLQDYYQNMTGFLTLAIFVATLLTIINIGIYFATLTQLRQRLKQSMLRSSIVMVSLYPIICAAALATILLPKSWLICHTVMHLSFTLGGPYLRILLFAYVGGEANFIKQMNGNCAQINTPPCCCCCPCLPQVLPTKLKLCILRYMVWQMPFVQGSIMLILNTLYYGDREMYNDSMYFFVPFIIASILLGMWSLNITVRMIGQLRANYALMRKLFALQCIVLLCKLQYLVLDNQLDALVLSTEYPINHVIYKQTIINLLILAEMALVSLLVQNAYRIPAQVQIDEDK